MAGRSELEWYVARDGRQYGPLTATEFDELERSGDLLDTDYVWNASFPEWIGYSAFLADAHSKRENAPTNERPADVSAKQSLVHLLARAVKAPRDGIRTATQLVLSPARFAQERLEKSPRDLQRSVWFFVNSFSLVILASSYFTYLDYYSGLSQPRELLGVVAQIVVALPLLFSAAYLSSSSISFSGITQAVLYVDSMMLMVGNGIAVSLAVITGDLGPRHLDIFGTEYERCLAEQSLAYWVLRGDLTFYAQPLWKAHRVIDWVRANLPYIVFVPFCMLFGYILHKRYFSSLWLMTIAAMVAFLIVVNLHDFANDKARKLIADKSDCFPKSISVAQTRYSRPLLIQQGADQINRQLSKVANQEKLVVHPLNDGYLLNLSDQANQLLVPETMAWLEDSRALYCHEGTNFRYARIMREPLTVVLHGANGQELARRTITPSDCKR